MKRKRILKALAILAVAALGLFVSCSGNIMDDVSDTLVYATFDKNSRATSSYTQTVTLKEIDEVYWTYTATKADSAGQTGETTSQTAVKSSFGTGLDGAIGPFSQGEWEFTVYGYTSAPTTQPSGTENADWVNVGTNQYYSGLIYRGSGNATLSTGTQSNPDPINVVINLLTDGAGTFSISNASDFSWQEDSGSAYSGMYLTMLASNGSTTKSEALELEYDATAKKYYFKKTDNKWPTLSWDFSSGSWYMEFAVVKANTDINAPGYTEKTGTYSSGGTYKYYSWDGIKYTFTTSPELLVKVYAGQETTLEAKIIESNLAWGEFNGSVESVKASTVMATVEANSDTTLESNITPQTASSDTIESDIKTTITVPSGTNEFTSGSTAAVTVTATPLVTANSLFKISSSSGAVGAIDLKATITTSSEDGTTETKSVENFTTGSGESEEAVEVTISTYIARGMTSVALTYTKDGTIETWNATASSSTDNNIKAPGGSTDGVCYYNAGTGQLVYKTTHFSTFLVGADQNIYDADNGIAYVLKDANGNGTYHIYDKEGKIIQESSSDSNATCSSATLGSNLVLLNCALSNNVPDAFVSDCTTEDKDKKTWSVIHHNCDEQSTGYCHEEYSSYFSSGYGTKIEPYLVENSTQFQNVSEIGKYGYYKWNGESTLNAKGWSPVYLCGSFDGNDLKVTNLDSFLFRCVWNGSESWHPREDTVNTYTIKNLDITADIKSAGWTAAVLRVAGVHNFVMSNVDVHGYIEGSYVASFISFGPGQYTYDSPFYQYAGNITFENCHSDATIVATGSEAVGFISHAMMPAGGKVNLIGSDFTGYLYATRNDCFKYICGNWINATVTDDRTSAEETLYDGKPNGWIYTAAGKTSLITVERKTIASDFSKVQKGDALYVDAAENASKAVIELQISPNPGNITSSYMKEEVNVEDNKFTSSEIKYFTVRVNEKNVKETGVHENYYDVISSYFDGTLGSDTIIRFAQYDSAGKILKVTNISLGDKTATDN